MAKAMLTDKGILAAKTAVKIMVLSDLKTNNLSVLVRPNGGKTFVWRGQIKGKPETITLGAYPLHDLASARAWANALTIDRDKGVDIKAAKAATRQAEVVAEKDAARTVTACFEIYFKHDGRKGKDAANKRAKFERELKPLIGDRPIGEITFDDLSGIVADKAVHFPGAALKLHALIARMWRWLTFHPIGRKASGLTTNAYAGAFAPHRSQVRTGSLSGDAIGWLYEALEIENPAWARLYKLLLLTGARRTSISGLRKDEIRIRDGRHYIHWDDTKNEKPYVLPLSPQAVAILEAARHASVDSQWFFPSSRREDDATHISGYSRAHQRIYDNMLVIAQFYSPGANHPVLDYWTMHDFRRTIRTWMAPKTRGISKGTAEAILSHTDGKTKIEATYDLFEYFDEKLEALTFWGEYIDALTRSASKTR